MIATCERGRERALGTRADLLQRAVAAAVLHDRARFEPVHADVIERITRHEVRRLDERADAPERGADREPPVRRMP